MAIRHARHTDTAHKVYGLAMDGASEEGKDIGRVSNHDVPGHNRDTVLYNVRNHATDQGGTNPVYKRSVLPSTVA
jgi:hypothetical protein